jgi:hypothetical protein
MESGEGVYFQRFPPAELSWSSSFAVGRFEKGKTKERPGRLEWLAACRNARLVGESSGYPNENPG